MAVVSQKMPHAALNSMKFVNNARRGAILHLFLAAMMLSAAQVTGKGRK
jgi:hypothetical protein